MLNWPAAIISAASCTAATLLDWLNVTRFCPVRKKKTKKHAVTKKRKVRGSKSHIRRRNLGKKNDMFGERSYKILLGEKHKQQSINYYVEKTAVINRLSPKQT